MARSLKSVPEFTLPERIECDMTSRSAAFSARLKAMRRTIQVRAFWGDRQYVAECLDLPVVTQAPTLDELASNIREAISLHLRGEDLAELGISSDPTVVVTFELQAVA
jgi:predicted RNase H-like HicB family nuclease